MKTSCPAGGTLFANATYHITDEDVKGSTGVVWAKATYQRKITIFQYPTYYCASWQDTGTFKTVAGAPSPGGGAHTEPTPDVTGTFSRTGVSSNFTGTPKDGTQKGTAQTPADLGEQPVGFDPFAFYFDGVANQSTEFFSDSFLGGTHGTWKARTGFLTYGDIF